MLNHFGGKLNFMTSGNPDLAAATPDPFEREQQARDFPHNNIGPSAAAAATTAERGIAAAAPG